MSDISVIAVLPTPDEEDEPIEETKVEIEKEKVELKREIDLIGAILVIVGSQIGSGIFVSPKGTFQYFTK